MPDLSRTTDASGAEAAGREETAAFLLSLRARGIRDTAVLRAMEQVPRDLFAPGRFSDLARADVSLPLPCGQTMTAPATIATMLVALAVEPHHRILEVGTGSGYVSAVLRRLGREVVTCERFRTLALSARTRLARIDLSGVSIQVADGLAPPADFGSFERILVNGTVPEVPQPLLALLAPGGCLVAARAGPSGPCLVRISHTGEGLAERSGDPVRLPPLVPGLAQAL